MHFFYARKSHWFILYPAVFMTFSSKFLVNLKWPDNAGAGSVVDSILRNALKVKGKLAETVLLSAWTYQACMLSRKYMLQKLPCLTSSIWEHCDGLWKYVPGWGQQQSQKNMIFLLPTVNLSLMKQKSILKSNKITLGTYIWLAGSVLISLYIWAVSTFEE